MDRRIVRYIVMLIVMLSLTSVHPPLLYEDASVYAKEAGHTGEHEGPANVHEEGEGHDHHSSVPPISYFLFWICLGLPLYLLKDFLRGDIIKEFKGEKEESHETGNEHDNVAFRLLGISIVLFLLNQGIFLSGYHEPSLIGFVRFALMSFIGIAMTAYAFTQMHEHH